MALHLNVHSVDVMHEWDKGVLFGLSTSVAAISLWCNDSGWDTYHTCLYTCVTYLLAHIMTLMLAEEAVGDFEMTG